MLKLLMLAGLMLLLVIMAVATRLMPHDDVQNLSHN